DRQRAAHDPGRQQRKLVNLVTDDERVPGIVAALKAYHGIGPARQPVDDLALSLIAPLGADYGNVGQGSRPSLKNVMTPARRPRGTGGQGQGRPWPAA